MASEVREGLSGERTSKLKGQPLEYFEKRVPSRGNRKCKGSEVRGGFVCLETETRATWLVWWGRRGEEHKRRPGTV